MLSLYLEKEEEPEIKLPTSVGSEKKKENSRKHLLLFYWLRQHFWLWITTNFKRWEYQTTLPASWEICMQVKKQQLELDMEKEMGSKRHYFADRGPSSQSYGSSSSHYGSES